MCPCVYKVGGSLLEWPELFPRLRELLTTDARCALLIAGGGAAADVVRRWDQAHRLGDAASHALAIEAMRLGAELLCAQLPHAHSVGSRAAVTRCWKAGGLPVLDLAAFMACEHAAGATPLPASWDVTSDSLAAWVAMRWPADLVLLKSTTPPASQFVDPYFSTAAAGVRRAEWVNLRSGERGLLSTKPVEPAKPLSSTKSASSTKPVEVPAGTHAPPSY